MRGAAYVVGSLALAIILFDSGFGTPLGVLRQAALPALVAGDDRRRADHYLSSAPPRII